MLNKFVDLIICAADNADSCQIIVKSRKLLIEVNMHYLLEVGVRRISDLKNIDVLFQKLKSAKDKSTKEKVLREMEVILEKIFSVHVVIDFHYFGLHADNFAVLPYIKPNKNVKIKEKKDFVKFINVKQIDLIFGNSFIKRHTPKELTAILLHEIGHLINYLSISRTLFLNMIYPIYLIARGFRLIPIIGVVFYPLFLITSRSLNFSEHIGEYQADKFVVKYGYGDELISAIKKWEKEETRVRKKLTLFERISMLQEILTKTSHPTNEDRILKIAEIMKKNYLKQYGGKRIQKLLSEYKV